MPTNKGLLKEDEMVLNLNKKRISELSPNLRTFINDLFGAVDDNEILHAKIIQGSAKPDFYVRYKTRTKYVSMKSGKSDTVHEEYIKNFVLYLRSLGVSTRTQQTILLFHYGDGTMDGTGKKRYEFEQLSYLLAERIKDANEELNKDYQFVKKVVDRCIFDGAIKDAIRADAIYHGDYHYGVMMNRKQLNKYLKGKDFTWINRLHIGPLLLRPCGRYVGCEVKNEKKRKTIDCYWPHFKDGVEYVSRRYDGYERESALN